MPEVDFTKAQKYVDKYGSALDHTRLRFIFDEELSEEDQKVIFEILQKHTASGLFPFNFDTQKPASVLTTIKFISQFHDILLTLELGNTIKDLVVAIFPFQNVDGSWRETDEFLAMSDLPVWANTNNAKTQVWVSTYITTVLALLPSLNVPMEILQKSLRFLTMHLDTEHGGLKGNFYTNFIAAPLFYSKVIGGKADLARYVPLLEKIIDETDYSGVLASILEQLTYINTPKVRYLIIAVFRKLSNLQNTDGSWSSEEGKTPTHHALTTTNVLIAYIKAEEHLKTFQKLNPAGQAQK